MKISKYGLELSLDRHPMLMEEYRIYGEKWPTTQNAKQVVALLTDAFHLNKKAEEYVYMIATDAKCQPIGIFELSHGTVNKSLLGTREVYERALLLGAVNIIIAHNHPSNNCAPSTEDLSVCERLQQAGNILGIPLVDFIIIGNGDNFTYLSFQQEGMLND